MASAPTPALRGIPQERILEVTKWLRRRAKTLSAGSRERLCAAPFFLKSVVVGSDPEILHGTPCFQGTRVPFKNLIDSLEGGYSLDEFVRQFPTVSREQAIQALEDAKDSLLAKIA